MPAKRLVPVLDTAQPRSRVVERALHLAGQGADELALRGPGILSQGLPDALGPLPLARVAWASGAQEASELLAAGLERVVVSLETWRELLVICPGARATVCLEADEETWVDRLALEGAMEVLVSSAAPGELAQAGWTGAGLPVAFHWRGGHLDHLVDLLAESADAIYLDGPVEGLEGGLPDLRLRLRDAGLLVRP